MTKLFIIMLHGLSCCTAAITELQEADEPPLIRAALQGSWSSVEALVNDDADVNTSFSTPRTLGPLFVRYAARLGRDGLTMPDSLFHSEEFTTMQ